MDPIANTTTPASQIGSASASRSRTSSMPGNVDTATATTTATTANSAPRRAAEPRSSPRSASVLTALRARLRRSRVGGTRERAHEVLELARGPALVRVAVLLVGGDHGVAVVPV